MRVDTYNPQLYDSYFFAPIDFLFLPLFMFRCAVLLVIVIPLLLLTTLFGYFRCYQVFHYCTMWFAKCLLFCFGFWSVSILDENKKPISFSVLPTNKTKTKVWVCNHLNGHVDGLIFLSKFGAHCSFVANKTLANVPVIGQLCKQLEFVFVDPNGQTGATKHVLDSLQKWEQNHRNKILVIFPEAGVTNGSGLMQFRKGAFVGGFPVQPLIISYPRSQNGFNVAAEGEILGSDKKFRYLYKIITCLKNRAQIQFLAEYYPSEEEKKNPELFADHVHKLMARAGNLVECKRYRDYLKGL